MAPRGPDDMPTIAINDTSLYFEDSGPAESGETIVFSHGLLWNVRMFDAQVEARRQHFRCVAYDHRGQGSSAECGLRSIDIDLVYRDAVALIEALDLGAVHFCGLSMGGFVAMRLGARRPDLVRSLILIETAARPERAERIRKYRIFNVLFRWFGYRTVADRIMPIMFGRSVLADPARATECTAWRRLLAGNRRSVWRAVNGVIERQGVEDELGRVVAPTLVIVGEEDTATPPEDAERLIALIPNSRLVRIPAAGHSSTVEQPALVNAAIGSFLQGARGAERRERIRLPASDDE